ncbi:type VI secretion system lipoprotein TssJ [Vibrio algivorus]|uniref:Type VI secretion lipoprotein n=1 Tax=Vibrio algivorus TaxID=1667024 RepID=A0A557NVY3_9VIBR|nr:type VI secretion system lipoprotein TssJ [Vibrio algivorus]TVO32571.1 type VI secretion system lipoprotein TssJ [Vibrio algivorus]GLT13673.1 type VI secretion lipoprotein [Vibrio algivorus]
MKFILSTLAMWVFLSGCSSDPKPEPEPTKITISMFADHGVNPNVEGVASPVEIQVFELVDDSMLLSTDYHQIRDDFKKALKSNFVKSYDYALTPGQFKFISDFEISDETNYIGVVVHFSDPDNSEWKKTVKIINKDHLYHLLVYFRDYEVILEKVE